MLGGGGVVIFDVNEPASDIRLPQTMITAPGVGAGASEFVRRWAPLIDPLSGFSHSIGADDLV